MGELEKTVGYTFQDPKLLELALTHSSYAHEHYAGKRHDNERLEFLGDAVLELVSSVYLFHNYNEYPEGELTKLRASIVCEQSLAMCAEAISLGKYLRLGNGEDSTGGRLRASITSDAMEALIGAIYLDGGFANAKEFVLDYVLNDIEHKKLFFDSKTIFQEMVQGNFPGEISYHPLGESGPDHDKTFSVEVWIGEQCMGQGSGRTKKAAEQMAAYRAICRESCGKQKTVGDVCI